ncbi:unnamed protein product [Adineta ricciae]|uniref:Uncharacterized protein n=1 Tax=Adineta ricciae TaxID=249248 RepID=A0A814SP68_ADIRI|nr:unnamed protein product [Adineta ricciae]CAF1149100.1 unnamed protein product [Adineta ricciae]
MRLFIVLMLLYFILMFQNTNGNGCCTCTCCRGQGCVPKQKPSFNVDGCDSVGKCNTECCQRYTQNCFPLPGPGYIDSVCNSSTVCT